MKGGREVFQNKICQAKWYERPPHSLNHFLTASNTQSFLLPRLRHKFLTSKTILKVDVVRLVLWENKIAFGKKKHGKFTEAND